MERVPKQGSGAKGSLELPPDVRQLLAAQLAAAEQVLELGRKLESRLGPLSAPAGGAMGAGRSDGMTKASSNGSGPAASGFDSPVKASPRGYDGGVKASPRGAMSLLEPLLRAGKKKSDRAPKPASPPPEPAVREFSAADAHAQRLSLFPDLDRLKEQAKEALTTPEYNVEDEYHERGFFQYVAKSNFFKMLTFAMILLNAIWIGVDTDFNHAPALYYAAPMFQLMETVFCSFFALEIAVRLLAFKRKRSAFCDGWFVFDSFLVAMMIWETWIVTALLALGIADASIDGDTGTASVFRLMRALRLSRVLRIGRLLQNMPEFLMMAKGMWIAMRSVFSTLVLMVAIIYVFAIIMVQMLANTPAATGCFENVPQAVNCLFVNAALSDQSSLLDGVLAQDLIAYLLALFYFIIGSLTLMNMLIGALCEVVSVVATEQAEVTKVDNFKEKLTVLLTEMDENCDLKISRDEFMALMVKPEMVTMLAELDVDLESFINHADVVCEQDVCDISTFVDIVMRFRDTNGVTVKDLYSVKKDLTAIRRGLCIAD